MNKNPYSSPEAVEQVDSEPLREYRRTLGLLARGLMCVMMSITLAWGYGLSEWSFVLDNVVWYAFLAVFCGLQLVGAVYCWRGAAGGMPGWRTLIVASAALAVPAVVFGHWSWRIECEPFFIAMLFFGFSCWCWQAFLLLLARQMKSRWLTWTAVLVLGTFSIAGFSTLAAFGGRHEPFVYVAMRSGFAYFGLYAILLIGLWKRLWSLVARSWEGEAELGNEEIL